MKLKVELNSPNDVQELQEYLYEKNPDLVVEEVYDLQAGFLKEPVSVAIIIALGGPVILKSVQVLIKEYFQWKIERTKEETKRKENQHKAKISIVKLSLQKNENWEIIQEDDFIKMNFN